MNRVGITNPDLTEQEFTELTADVSAGDTVSLTVENNQGFAADDYVVFNYGEEKAEVAQISSVSGSTTIVVDSIDFDHDSGIEIRVTPYNKVKLYSASEEDGSYTEVADWSDLDWDAQVTYIDDSDGTDSTWYKAEYKNATTSQLSGESDAFQVKTHYIDLDYIYEEAGMKGNRYISADRVYRLRSKAESLAKGIIGARYSLPLSEVPEVVSEAVRLIAAGRLMLHEYGTDMRGTRDDGQAKIDSGRAMLEDIKNGKIILLDSDDTELSRSTERGITGYPDDEDTDERKFAMDQKF